MRKSATAQQVAGLSKKILRSSSNFSGLYKHDPNNMDVNPNELVHIDTTSQEDGSSSHCSRRSFPPPSKSAPSDTDVNPETLPMNTHHYHHGNMETLSSVITQLSNAKSQQQAVSILFSKLPSMINCRTAQLIIFDTNFMKLSDTSNKDKLSVIKTAIDRKLFDMWAKSELHMEEHTFKKE